MAESNSDHNVGNLSDAEKQYERELGEKIRAIRTDRGLTIKEVAAGSGVSKSLISQVERGRASPSLNTLRRVAEYLGVPLALLFTNHDDVADQDSDVLGRQLVVRAADRPRLYVDPDVDYELLTPDSDRSVEFLACSLEPGVSIPREPGLLVRHHGEENVLCLENSVEFVIEGRRYKLEAGDSISFEGMSGHRVENNSSDLAARFVAVICPPARLDGIAEGGDADA